MSDSLSRTERPFWWYWQARFMEYSRTTAAYLGVAVMVTVLMLVCVPTLRSQASMLHEAVLAALVTGEQDVDPSVAIDPVAVAAQPRPVNLAGVPARALARLRPETESQGADPELTDKLGLLGNNEVDLIVRSMQHFGMTNAHRDALESYIARKYWVGKNVIHRLTETVLLAAHEYDLNPLLILAVMSVESRFNPYAESGAGAQGLMQVMTPVHRDKFESLGVGAEGAFHPQHNIWVGSRILADCIKRRGSVLNGLKCYVGASGPNDGGYGNKVLAEQRRMALAAKVPLPRS